MGRLARPLAVQDLTLMKHLLSLLAVSLQALAPVFAADVTITAASVVPSSSAKTIRREAGVALTAGQLVYVEYSTNQFKLADANSATAEVRRVAGIVVTSGAAGTIVSAVTRDYDLTLGGTTAKGTVYLLSATAGGIAPLADLTTGWYPHILCVGKSTTKVCFDAGYMFSDTAQ